MEGAGGAYELCSLADVVSCGVCGLRLEADLVGASESESWLCASEK